MPEDNYVKYTKILKILADPKRLKIVEMLSCQELCACDILEEFKITQPTLSHDMKLLCDVGIVTARKEGKWSYYSVNREILVDFYEGMGSILVGRK